MTNYYPGANDEPEIAEKTMTPWWTIISREGVRHWTDIDVDYVRRQSDHVRTVCGATVRFDESLPEPEPEPDGVPVCAACEQRLDARERLQEEAIREFWAIGGGDGRRM